MSEHFLGSNKAFEILANLGLDPLIMKVTGHLSRTASRFLAWNWNTRKDRTKIVINIYFFYLKKERGGQWRKYVMRCVGEDHSNLRT